MHTFPANRKFYIQALGLALLTALLNACGWLGGSAKETPFALDLAKQEKSSAQPLIESVASAHAEYPRERAPGSFYVALRPVPEWLPGARDDCIDQSVFTGLRRLLRNNAMLLALVAKINPGDGMQEVRVPLFVIGRDENPAPGEPGCFSEVTERRLTPLLRADKNTAFHIDFEIYTSAGANFKLAEQLVSLGNEVLSLSGGSAWLLDKLAGDRFQAAGKRINEALDGAWSTSARTTYRTTLQVFPDAAGWEKHYDARRFNLGPILEQQGFAKTARAPTTTVEIAYVDSLFANGGRYPEDPAALLSTSISTGTGGESTLDDLLHKGINNVTREYLLSAVETAQMERYCVALRGEFGKHLSPQDALAARYSALKLHSYYDRSKALRSAKCFDAAEEAELKAMEYAFAELERHELRDRSRRVKDLLDPLVSALKANDAERIRSIFSGPQALRLEVWDPDTLPAREGEWDAEGEAVFARLDEIGALKPLLGCYQAPADSDLHLLGLVVRIGGRPAGWALHFEDGKLVEITVGEVRKIRKFARLPDAWPEGCPLL